MHPITLYDTNTRVFVLKHPGDFTPVPTEQGGFELRLTNTTRFIPHLSQGGGKVLYKFDLSWLTESDLLSYTPHSEVATLEFSTWTCDSVTQLAADPLLSEGDRATLKHHGFFLTFEDGIIVAEGEVVADLVNEQEK